MGVGWRDICSDSADVSSLPTPGFSITSKANAAGVCLGNTGRDRPLAAPSLEQGLIVTVALAFLLRALKSVRKEAFVWGRKDK